MENKFKITVLSKDEYINEASGENYLVHEDNTQTINDVIFFDEEKAKEYIEFKNRKIDRETKIEAIDYYENEIEICKNTIELNEGKKWCSEYRVKIEQYENLIEIIKSLRSEE